jgi:hypothetical protein
MAHDLNTTQSPMASIVGVISAGLYGLFVPTGSIFLNFQDFAEHAVKAIVLATIGWGTTKVLEKYYKKGK